MKDGGAMKSSIVAAEGAWLPPPVTLEPFGAKRPS
jgi:hypothetical protein